MITVDIFGGLGNQMFQYALGRHLALKNNSELTLRFIDVGAFSKREYVLGCFKLAQGIQVEKAVGNRQEGFLRKIREILGRKETIVREKSFPFDSSVLNSREKNIHLFGYWQSEKYFKDIRKIILEDFAFIKPLNRRNQETLLEITDSNSVSIHVRRGDYVADKKTQEFHGVYGSDYYSKAIKAVSKMVRQAHHEPVFFFFSDDIDWVKKNIKTKFNNVYVDWNTGDRSYVDMQLMKSCKHNILANSSFSWWGAWLNQNPNKIVIAPTHWFRDPSVDTIDLIPEGWMRI